MRPGSLVSTPHTNSRGDVEWRTPGGVLHREDGPALIRVDGLLDELRNLSRPYGPAVTKIEGYEAWYFNGVQHREDGPAVTWSDGTQVWFWHGEYHRLDGPAVTWPDGYEIWYLHGERHRTDGPAITRPDGRVEWWQDGKMHRSDGPAIVHPDGSLEWWMNDERKPPEIEDVLTMLWRGRTPEAA